MCGMTAATMHTASAMTRRTQNSRRLKSYLRVGEHMFTEMSMPMIT